MAFSEMISSWRGLDIVYYVSIAEIECLMVLEGNKYSSLSPGCFSVGQRLSVLSIEYLPFPFYLDCLNKLLYLFAKPPMGVWSFCLRMTGLQCGMNG